MSDEKISRAAEILKRAYDAIGDRDQIIQNKKAVLERYGPKFSSGNIRNLSWKEFKDFLDYDNNHHWNRINLQVKLNRALRARFEDLVRPALINLVDERLPIEDRIEGCYKVKGLGKATVTPILLVAHPDKYGVWNSVSEWALKTLGLWLEKYPTKSSEYLTKGKTYEYVNSTLKDLSLEMNADLWTLDAIFYYFSLVSSNQVQIDLQEGKKYSRKDLCEIFFPEFKFGDVWGKVGITGVIALDLGLKKDYALMAVADKSKGKERPEIVYEDGTFEWITQQRFRRNNRTPLAKRLRCKTDSNVLLFFKNTNSEGKFTYFGQLEYEYEDKDEDGDRRFVYKIKSFDSIKRKLELNEGELISSLNPKSSALLEKVRPPAFAQLPIGNSSSGQENAGNRRYNGNDDENKKLGTAGELLVMEYEKKKLEGTNLKPKHISLENDDAGYDIKSYRTTGEEILIEVKTTRGGISTPFYFSANEYMVSKAKSSKYVLYRLFNYSPSVGAKFYTKEGSLEELSPTPVKYMVKVKL